MKSHTTARFRRSFSELPETIQRQAREAYKLFRKNPRHPSLRFRQVHPSMQVYSVRISIHYRALGIREGKEIIWFWIGSHADYEKLISQI